MRELLEDWSRSARAAGSDADDATLTAAGAELLDRWQEPHRRYHDVRHLSEVLDALTDLIAPDVEHLGAPDPIDPAAGQLAAVQLAAWFHDAVHDGQPGRDEERSAALAAQVLGTLGVPYERVAVVTRLVVMTVDHCPAPGDREAELLCDADLAILGSTPQRYAEYVAAVRAEYAQIADPDFRAGRIAVLRALIDMPRLFRTARGRRSWEDAARTNVAAELDQLCSIHLGSINLGSINLGSIN